MATIVADPGSDFRLASEAQAGSHGAFEAIVAKYSDRIYTAVFRIVGNAAEAEEIVQECFLRAWRSLNGFQREAGIYTWLYRIAVNAAFDQAKKSRRRRALPLEGGHDELAEQLPESTPAPSQGLERAELLRTVRDGIGALPEHYRAILVLREYEDMSYEELAELLQIPLGTVESRLFRARAKLREWLLQRLGAEDLGDLSQMLG